MVLITGVAGFIGSALAKALIKQNIKVVGIDNLKDTDELQLKRDRLEDIFKVSADSELFTFVESDICDAESIEQLFAEYLPEYVVNLAAQAGVRKSIEDPILYLKTNVLGFTNILEACKKYPVKHLVYASSSSVYGANTNMPFKTDEPADHPLSIYASSKRSNELISHAYSHLFGTPITGLRFFTVYGPWGRPDMALYLFANKIMNGEPIDLFNEGNHVRDFTYVDDIVNGICQVMVSPPQPNPEWDSKNPACDSSAAPWRVYNVGRNQPVKLIEYINALEHHLGKKAIKNMLPLQPGDVPATWADVSNLMYDHQYEPKVSIFEGVGKFVAWYKKYYEHD